MRLTNAEYQRRWRQRNPEQALATAKAWRDKNKTRLSAKQKLWRKKYGARSREQSDEYNRRREMLKNHPERREAYRVKQREYKHRHPLEHTITYLLAGARSRAAATGKPYDLTRDWLRKRIVGGVCEATGVPFGKSGKGDTGSWGAFAPSLDRKNRSKGYTKRNVRVVVTAFNIGRNVWGDQVFETVARGYLETKRARTVH